MARLRDLSRQLTTSLLDASSIHHSLTITASENPNPVPRTFDTPLPIDAVLGELSGALQRATTAVLVAPPGAGKFTAARRWRYLMSPGSKVKRSSYWSRAGSRREPVPSGWRRHSARALAIPSATACEFGSKISRKTRIEVVTEGIFTRQILDDPELKGIVAVLFDEFHERLLDADLGLRARA